MRSFLLLIQIFFRLYSSIFCQLNDQEVFPGFSKMLFNNQKPIFSRQLKSLPVGDNKKLNGAVVWTPTGGYIPPPPNEAFLPVQDDQGQMHMVPKFVYFDSHTDSKIKANFKSPNLRDIPSTITNFLSGSGGYRKNVKSLGGIYVPMPYPLSPLAFQLIGSDKIDTDHKIGLGTKSLQSDQTDRLDDRDLLVNNIRSIIGRLTRTNSDHYQSTKSQRDFSPSDHSANFQQNFAAQNSRNDVTSRLFQNVMEWAIGKTAKSETQNEQQIGSIGATVKNNTLTKAAGLYMSLPGLPPSYLGSTWDLVDADTKTFG